MTTVMMSLVGILIFGAVMLASLSYADSTGMSSSADSVIIAERLQLAAELAADIELNSGNPPENMSELWNAGLPQAVVNTGETLVIQNNFICFVLPATPQNKASIITAAERVGGVASGQCGNINSPIGNSAVAMIQI